MGLFAIIICEEIDQLSIGWQGLAISVLSGISFTVFVLSWMITGKII